MWTAPDSPRIWRAPGSHAGNDEARDAARTYDDAALARIAAEGFTGIWLFCQLHELMQSAVFPELNDARASERLAGIQAVVDRAAARGLGVYLYFNDPGGLPQDHPFWSRHPDLGGVTHWHLRSLCTSTPQVQAFFRDAIDSIFARLRGVAGVILITACENLTHCWSKRNTRAGMAAPDCPRCRGREPADLVLDLLGAWAELRARRPGALGRVIAWNWEWAYWYADPQAEIIGRLPPGVELLLDLEIGGTRPWQARTNYIGEYSLSFAGPGQRFLAAAALARERGLPFLAKIELNNTHELCTVPNLPVLATLHTKFRALTDAGAAGVLACWTMGSRCTLNTFACREYVRSPQAAADCDAFLGAVAREYFGLVDTAAAVHAWHRFSDAFAHYPFTVAMLYFGPHNDAPGRVLSLEFRGQPAGRSFAADPPGDDLAPALKAAPLDRDGGFALDEVIDGFARLCAGWDAGFAGYECALGPAAAPVAPDPEQARRREEELRCACMIGLQLRSTLNAFRFQRERARVCAEHGLKPPCRLPPAPGLLAIMRDEIANAERALPLVAADPRLGFHQDIQRYKYDAAAIRAKITQMQAEVTGATAAATAAPGAG